MIWGEDPETARHHPRAERWERRSSSRQTLTARRFCLDVEPDHVAHPALLGCHDRPAQRIGVRVLVGPGDVERLPGSSPASVAICSSTPGFQNSGSGGVGWPGRQIRVGNLHHRLEVAGARMDPRPGSPRAPPALPPAPPRAAPRPCRWRRRKALDPVTRSNVPSSYGRASISRRAGRPRAGGCASSISAPDASRPNARAPWSVTRRRNAPAPQPMSSTRWPALRSTRSSAASYAGVAAH
jgi:hypothetical protein